jgi:hypothetical protein
MPATTALLAQPANVDLAVLPSLSVEGAEVRHLVDTLADGRWAMGDGRWAMGLIPLGVVIGPQNRSGPIPTCRQREGYDHARLVIIANA